MLPMPWKLLVRNPRHIKKRVTEVPRVGWSQTQDAFIPKSIVWW